MKRPIFFSSALTDSHGLKPRIRELVEKAVPKKGVGANEYRPVWMSEDFRALDRNSSLGPLETVQLCLDGVRESECVVAVLTGRHGTKVNIEKVGEVPATFLETELFEAALLGKPAFIFILDGYTPEPGLESLLDLLQPFFPNMNRVPVSEAEVLRQVESLIRHYERPRWLRPLFTPPKLRETVQALARRRHRPYDVHTELPSLRFLEDPHDPTLPRPDPGNVELLLERASRVETEQERLTLLWFAIRALTGAPFTDPRFSDLAYLWDRALGAWTSAAAWYGLHGHLELGCLAALGSICEIRKNAGMATLPHGALASEYYSIAGLTTSQELFALALKHIEEAISESKANSANAIAIRGSIYRKTGHLSAAIADYETVAESRREQGGAAYGEALNELGYAQMLNWNMKQGINSMERGLELLNQQPPGGFTIRAMRKLALGYARGGRLLSAADLSAAAHDLAFKLGAYDQIGRLERLAHRFDRRRIWRR
jgi:hypothetical protein